MRERLNEAISLHEALGAPEEAARARTALAGALVATEDLDEAIELAGRAYADLPEGDVARAAAAATLSRAHAFQEDYERGLDAADAALAVAEPLQAWDVLCEALLSRGVHQHYSGRIEESRALHDRALALALEHELGSPALRAYMNASNSDIVQDRLESALERAQAGVALAHSRGDRLYERTLMMQSTFPLVLLGRWEEVERIAARLLEEAPESLDTLAVLAPLARVQSARGERAEAERTLALAVGFGGKAHSEYAESAAVVQAIAVGALGRPAEALELAKPVALSPRYTPYEDRREAFLEAGKSAVTLGDDPALAELVAFAEGRPPAGRPPVMRALAARFAGVLAAHRGDAREARERFDIAARILRETGCPFLLAQVLLEHGELVAGDDAPDLLREARDLFAGLAAAPWLERAERALAPAVA